MKDNNRKNTIKPNAFLVLLAIAMLTTALTNTAAAKSLYVIADIKGSTTDSTQPVQAYDIGVDGTLTFQAQHDIPHSMLGAVGMAIDSDNGYIFITYEASGEIRLIEAITMKDAGYVVAPDAMDLAGIVYDHEKSLLYCVDRNTSSLYVYNWWPETATLTHVSGSPFALRNASAYGIALNEIDDLLYVANANNTVTVYNTSNWSLADTISVSRIAISIAVDVTNGLIYTGGGWAGNMYLTQYHLATGTEAEVQVEPDAGVMGLSVDPDTSLIYMSTGKNNQPGGDNLLVYDTALNQIDIITAIGNPTGLAIPGKDIGYNPLNLDKQVLRGATAGAGPDDIKTVSPGDTYTYGIYFDNTNDYTVTDVSIVDILPREVIFISADDDEVNGHYEYDDKTDKHSYTWTYQELPPRTSTLLEITVQVKEDVDPGTIITNSVTINSNQTASTTTSVEVIVGTDPLNLKKSILGAIEGQVTHVQSNDIITYIIDFNNKKADSPVTEVIVTDTLSKDVTFISAKDKNGNEIGKYNDKERTWTWSLNALQPEEEVQLTIEVSVNPNLPLGTTITNVVTVECNEAPPSSSSVDAVVSYKPLIIAMKAIDVDDNEITWIEPGKSFTYKIRFDNDNNSEVTNVLIVDELPGEVTFTSDGNADGNYDEETHTYTWLYGTMAPESTDNLELTVNVKENTPLNTIIANTVTIDSDETPEAIADVNVVTDEPDEPLDQFEVDILSITPNVLRRNGTGQNIIVAIQFPSHIKKEQIDQNVNPKLYYQDQNSNAEHFSFIGEGHQYVSETNSGPKVVIFFSRAELMDEVPGYGQVTLKVQGELILEDQSHLPYIGKETIQITRFLGD